jgi:hypothetical protein
VADSGAGDRRQAEKEASVCERSLKWHPHELLGGDEVELYIDGHFNFMTMGKVVHAFITRSGESRHSRPKGRCFRLRHPQLCSHPRAAPHSGKWWRLPIWMQVSNTLDTMRDWRLYHWHMSVSLQAAWAQVWWVRGGWNWLLRYILSGPHWRLTGKIRASPVTPPKHLCVLV